MCIGDDTLNELERAIRPAEPNPSEALDIIDESPTNKTCIASRSLRYQRQKHSSTNKTNNRKSKDTKLPESNDFIDESPNNQTTNITSRSTRLRSQNQRRIENPKSKPAEAASNNSENYSEFFKNSLEFGDEPGKSTAELAALSIDNSLEKYFNTTFESPIDPINVKLSQNFDAMFQDSESSETQLLDIAITHSEDFADLSFTDFRSFTFNEAVPKAASQDIEWDDSIEFNNIVIPTDETDLATLRQTELMVNNDVAVGIDNDIFAQDFLPQRTVKNNSTLDSQKTVAQFMSEEMDKCIDVVKSALGEDELISTSFIGSQQQLNQSSLSNIVLNWSMVDVPRPKVVESTNYVTQQEVQATSKSLPTTNLSSIESWGLSKEIVQGYVKKGIQTMFPWQVECLSNTKVGLLLENCFYC